MRILLVTARPTYAKGWLKQIRDDLDFAADQRVAVLAVLPPKSPRSVERFVAVDPSMVPFRPVEDVAVLADRGSGRGAGRVVRLLRLLRRGWVKVAGPPAPERLPVHLAVACRTSAVPAQMARGADVVIALEPAAALGVWHLARRVPGPVYAYGVAAAREIVRRRGLDDDERRAEATTATRRVRPDESPLPEVPAATARLLIAPVNHAGQGRAWARAVAERLPDVAAQSFAVGGAPAASDTAIDAVGFAGDLEWRRRWRRHVQTSFTHVLAEAGRPVLGGTVTGIEDQYGQLSRAGIAVARVAHGSEIRIPSVDAAANPWASYAHLSAVSRRYLEAQARRGIEVFSAHDGPIHVSTVGLLDFLPHATWLPLVADVGDVAGDQPVLARERPVVAHCPSTAPEGLAHIHPILEELDAAGVLSYRRMGNVVPTRRHELLADVDVFVECVGLADYGLAACEAMMLGRVVVSHVAASVRERMPDLVGSSLPIVEADPTTLRDVLLGLFADRDRAVQLAVQSRQFAAAAHSGQRSAQVLRPWLLGDRTD